MKFLGRSKSKNLLLSVTVIASFFLRIAIAATDKSITQYHQIDFSRLDCHSIKLTQIDNRQNAFKISSNQPEFAFIVKLPDNTTFVTPACWNGTVFSISTTETSLQLALFEVNKPWPSRLAPFDIAFFDRNSQVSLPHFKAYFDKGFILPISFNFNVNLFLKITLHAVCLFTVSAPAKFCSLAMSNRHLIADNRAESKVTYIINNWNGDIVSKIEDCTSRHVFVCKNSEEISQYIVTDGDPSRVTKIVKAQILTAKGKADKHKLFEAPVSWLSELPPLKFFSPYLVNPFPYFVLVAKTHSLLFLSLSNGEFSAAYNLDLLTMKLEEISLIFNLKAVTFGDPLCLAQSSERYKNGTRSGKFVDQFISLYIMFQIKSFERAKLIADSAKKQISSLKKVPHGVLSTRIRVFLAELDNFHFNFNEHRWRLFYHSSMVDRLQQIIFSPNSTSFRIQRHNNHFAALLDSCVVFIDPALLQAHFYDSFGPRYKSALATTKFNPKALQVLAWFSPVDHTRRKHPFPHITAYFDLDFPETLFFSITRNGIEFHSSIPKPSSFVGLQLFFLDNQKSYYSIIELAESKYMLLLFLADGLHLESFTLPSYIGGNFAVVPVENGVLLVRSSRGYAFWNFLQRRFGANEISLPESVMTVPELFGDCLVDFFLQNGQLCMHCMSFKALMNAEIKILWERQITPIPPQLKLDFTDYDFPKKVASFKFLGLQGKIFLLSFSLITFSFKKNKLDLSDCGRVSRIRANFISSYTKMPDEIFYNFKILENNTPDSVVQLEIVYDQVRSALTTFASIKEFAQRIEVIGIDFYKNIFLPIEESHIEFRVALTCPKNVFVSNFFSFFSTVAPKVADLISAVSKTIDPLMEKLRTEFSAKVIPYLLSTKQKIVASLHYFGLRNFNTLLRFPPFMLNTILDEKFESKSNLIELNHFVFMWKSFKPKEADLAMLVHVNLVIIPYYFFDYSGVVSYISSLLGFDPKYHQMSLCMPLITAHGIYLFVPSAFVGLQCLNYGYPIFQKARFHFILPFTPSDIEFVGKYFAQVNSEIPTLHVDQMKPYVLLNTHDVFKQARAKLIDAKLQNFYILNQNTSREEFIASFRNAPIVDLGVFADLFSDKNLGNLLHLENIILKKELVDEITSASDPSTEANLVLKYAPRPILVELPIGFISDGPLKFFHPDAPPFVIPQISLPYIAGMFRAVNPYFDSLDCTNMFQHPQSEFHGDGSSKFCFQMYANALKLPSFKIFAAEVGTTGKKHGKRHHKK